MKKILFSLIALFVIASVSFGQNKRINSVVVDTVKGAETVYFDLNPSTPTTRDGIMAFQALFTNIAGTSNERAYLEFSVDGTSYVRYSDAVHNDGIRLFASDTSKIDNLGNEFTVTTTGVFGGIIESMPWKYYRIAVVGEANDTTKVTAKYQFVEKK